MIKEDVLEIYDLSDDVLCGVTYRIGGNSKKPYKSLNLGFNTGDRYEDIFKNYETLINNLELKDYTFFLTNQIHEDKIKVIDKSDLSDESTNEDTTKGSYDFDFKNRIRFVDGHDGMVTDLPNIALLTFYADCVPLVFYDPIKKVIGNCHAGWRGTVKRIPEKLIMKMIEEFGSNPSDIRVAIGPCASKCCYEVDSGVINEFDANNFPNDIYETKEDGKFMLDLKSANKSTLLLSGVKEENIEISNSCTICNNDLFFSYRLENGSTGRHCAIICKK